MPQWKILGKEEKIIKALIKQEPEGVSIKEEYLVNQISSSGMFLCMDCSVEQDPNLW